MYKLGIDVGGTNTDAVLVDENRAVVADIKYPTSADIYDGILGAMLMYGREAQSKTRIANPATIPKSGERNRKIHSCMLYLISI